jgi:hypothetical protein
VPSSSAVVSLSVSVQRSYNRLRSRSPSKPQRGERRVTDLCTKSAGDHLSCRHLDYISHCRGIAFWNNINLDLTGAQLIDFVVWDCHLRRGVFDGDLHRSGLFRRGALRPKGQFLQHDLHGSVGFDRATFTGNAVFRGATFAGDVNLFRGAQFAYEPDFKNSTQRGQPFVPPQLQPAQKSWTSEGDDSAS